MSDHYIKASNVATNGDVQAAADRLERMHARTRVYIALLNLIAVLLAALTAYLTARVAH